MESFRVQRRCPYLTLQQWKVGERSKGATVGMKRSHAWLLPDLLVLLPSYWQLRETPQVTLVLESHTRSLRDLLGTLPVRVAGLGSADLNLYQLNRGSSWFSVWSSHLLSTKERPTGR